MQEILGRFTWYDLMTPDTAAAEAFYTALMGWGTLAWEGGDKPYTMWTVGEQPIGGLATLPEEARAMGAPPHWLAYVGTPDVDATTAEARSLGGAVFVPPTDIPTVGRFSVIADPTGAVVALFTPAGDPPASPAEGTPGTMSWHELISSDPEAAFAFYGQLFGWVEVDRMDMGPDGVYLMYGHGEVPYGGIMKKPEQMPQSAWLYYTVVADMDAALGQVRAAGGTVMNGPMEVPGGDHVAQCLDPQGAAFAVHAKAG